MKKTKLAKSKPVKAAQKVSANTKKDAKPTKKAAVLAKQSKPEKASKKALPAATIAKVSKVTKTDKEIKKAVVIASPKQSEAKTLKATKTAVSVAGPAMAKGQARVIEPLSWDAEKPKLNLALTMKATRATKEKDDAEIKSYSIKARYTVGDRVIHQDFGKGLVRDLIGDFKIRVAFRDFEKVLVHGINQ